MNIFCQLCSGWCELGDKGCNENYRAVDNKHNVKNDQYQLIGGSGVPLVGKYVANVDLIRQVGVQEDLFIVKDFASDKKVKELFLYGTIKKIEDAITDGWADRGLWSTCCH
jgi:hypothetical protein